MERKFQSIFGYAFLFLNSSKINCDQIDIALCLNKEPEVCSAERVLESARQNFCCLYRGFWLKNLMLTLNVEISKHWLYIPVNNTWAIFYRHTCMWREYSNKRNNSFIKLYFISPKKLWNVFNSKFLQIKPIWSYL